MLTEQDIFTDEYWMQQAIELAEHARDNGEVPVGAIVVSDDKVIGKGMNQPISNNDPSAHAEIQAIRDACQNVQNYRLSNAKLYVTLEPCPMCAGAIVQSRIQKVIFAAHEPRAGAAESVFSLLNNAALNHRCEVVSGVLAEQSSSLLKTFFKARRQ